MSQQEQAAQLTDLADDALVGAEWQQWLREHPQAALEVQAAQQARSIVAELRAAPIAVPDDFAAHVMGRVRGNATLQDLLQLSLPHFGGVALELCALLFGSLPAKPEASPPAAPEGA